MSHSRKHKFKNAMQSRHHLPKLPSPPPNIAEPETKESERPSLGKKPIWKRFAVWIWALVVFLLGFIGCEALLPQVVIDASQAVDSGFLSNQFTFGNQAVYPVEIAYLTIYIVDVSWPKPFNSQFQNIGIWCPNVTIKIKGRDSGTVKIGNMFSMVDTNNPPTKISEGSKFVIKATYKLPISSLTKTDSALFECARDSSGNTIWIKKPIGKYANYKCDYGFVDISKINGD